MDFDKTLVGLTIVLALIVVFGMGVDFGKKSLKTKTVSQAEAPEATVPVATISREHATNKFGQCVEVVDNKQMTEWFVKHLEYQVEMMTMTGNCSTIVVFHK